MQEPDGVERDSTDATTAETETGPGAPEGQPDGDQRPAGPARAGAATDATEAGAAGDTSDISDPEGDTSDAAAAAADGEAPGKEKPPRKGKKLFRELVIILAAAIVLTLLVKAFVVQVYRIPSASMENTLLPGDRVLVNKLIYHFRGIHRGDIIVFSGAGSWGNLDGSPVPPPPSNPVVRFFDGVLADVGIHDNTTYYIKRVIGLPGDHVACCTNGLVTVNGVPLHETGYIYPGAPASAYSFSVTVPPGRLWVMGDNRNFSDDSVLHDKDGFPDQGTVPESTVTGRAFLIIWPFSRIGDLPIPNTFEQASLSTAPSSAAILLITPYLLYRRRKHN
jgi:signal peptidase I